MERSEAQCTANAEEDSLIVTVLAHQFFVAQDEYDMGSWEAKGQAKSGGSPY